MRRLRLLVEAADVVEELEGHVVTDLFYRGRRRDGGQEPLGVRNVHFLGDSARNQFGQEGMESTHDPSPMAAEVDIALGQDPEDLGVVSHLDAAQARGRKAATAIECASLGSFLLERPVASTRMREAKVAGTSSTSSP